MLWVGRQHEDYLVSTLSEGQEHCPIYSSLQSYQKILAPIKFIGVLPLSSVWAEFHQGVLIGLTTQINKARRVWLSVTYARFQSAIKSKSNPIQTTILKPQTFSFNPKYTGGFDNTRTVSRWNNKGNGKEKIYLVSYFESCNF